MDISSKSFRIVSFILVAFLSPEFSFAQCHFFLNFSNKVTDIEGVDASRAYAVGTDGLLLRQSDRDDSWTQVPIDSDIDFKDIDHEPYSVWVAGGNSGVVVSMDDGTTWSQIYDGDVNAVELLSASTYLLATQGAILITNNEGATWSPILDDPQWQFQKMTQ